MEILFLFFIFLLFNCFHPSVQFMAREQFFRKAGNFIVDLSHKLDVLPFQTFNVSSVFECTFQCVENDKCLSFNLAVDFIGGLKLCQLLSTDKYSTPGVYKGSSAFNLHSIDIGLPSGVISPPCGLGMEFRRYYWIGKHECACPKVPGKQYGWVKLNTKAPVYVQSAGDRPGTLTVPRGGQIRLFKLVHLSGAMSCWPSSPNHAPTKFGCGENFHIFITDNSRTVLTPKVYSVYMNYQIDDCAKTNDPVVVLPEVSPAVTVTAGQQLQVWYGEDLSTLPGVDGDNIGSVYMDVYANYSSLSSSSKSSSSGQLYQKKKLTG